MSGLPSWGPARIWIQWWPGKGIRGRRHTAVMAQGGQHGDAFPQSLSVWPGPAEAEAEMQRLIAEGGYVPGRPGRRR